MKKNTKLFIGIASFLLVMGVILLSQLNSRVQCEVVRAAFEIGSGTTKMKVARIDVCTNKIIKVLEDASIAVNYKEDLDRPPRSVFSDSIQEKGLMALEELKKKAQVHSPKDYLGMATSPFRKAENAGEFVLKIKEKLDIEIRIITQEQEAILGYMATVANLETIPKQLVVWDIGGGSMQMVGSLKGPEILKKPMLKGQQEDPYIVFEGKLAASNFKDLLIEKVQNRSLKTVGSPNPMSASEIDESVRLAKEYAETEVSAKMKALIRNPETLVVGIGGVHFHSVQGQIDPEGDLYTRDEIRKKLSERSGLTDRELGGPYASTEVSNLCLALGMMEALEIEQVETMNMTMADGILLSLDKNL